MAQSISAEGKVAITFQGSNIVLELIEYRRIEASERAGSVLKKSRLVEGYRIIRPSYRLEGTMSRQAEDDVRDFGLKYLSSLDSTVTELVQPHYVTPETEHSKNPYDDGPIVEMLDQVRHHDGAAAADTTLEVQKAVIDMEEGALTQELLEEASESPTSKYELRPQDPGYKPGFTSTWMDRDETGDYDPVEERRQLMKRNHRRKPQAKLPKPLSCDGLDEEKTESILVPSVVPRLIVTLQFTKEQLLKDLHRSFSEHSESGQEYSRGGRRLRRRGVEITPYQCGNIHNSDLDDQKQRLGHYRGHPAARGCRQCFELHFRCSLLDNDHNGPCTCCDESQTDCELITIPKYKEVCERCRKQKLTCSYAFTTNHNGPCADCTATGSHCIAGPVKDSVRPRIRYGTSLSARAIARFCDGNLNAATLPLQKEFKPELIFTCENCTEAGRHCSFERRSEDTVCTACDMDGTVCVKKPLTRPVEKPTQIHGLEDGEKPQEACEIGKKRTDCVSAFPSPPAKMQKLGPRDSNLDCQVKLKQVTTSFSHPISFNHITASGPIDQDQACHFCTPKYFAYPLLGDDRRRTLVVQDDPSKAGLIEINPSAYERTRMCLACTTIRLNIISCDSHHLHPIPGIGLAKLDFEGALSNLFAPAHKANYTRHDRWCSLCPNLAVRECAALPDSYGHKPKCGLALCVVCATELESARYRGNLQALLMDLQETGNEDRPLGLRADWELLKADGLLARFVRWTFLHDEKKVAGV
nr:hypothetical protein CFP56_57693 [Quercus suber]